MLSSSSSSLSTKESRSDYALLKDQTILITGGAGFIGTALARRLSKENQVILFMFRHS